MFQVASSWFLGGFPGLSYVICNRKARDGPLVTLDMQNSHMTQAGGPKNTQKGPEISNAGHLVNQAQEALELGQRVTSSRFLVLALMEKKLPDSFSMVVDRT